MSAIIQTIFSEHFRECSTFILIGLALQLIISGGNPVDSFIVNSSQAISWTKWFLFIEMKSVICEVYIPEDEQCLDV